MHIESQHSNRCLLADIDECALDALCDISANCTNTDGSYICMCNEGYSGSGINCLGICSISDYQIIRLLCHLQLFLSDVDECILDSTCDINANCTNTNGSYTCTCGDGFLGDGLVCIQAGVCFEKNVTPIVNTSFVLSNR